MPGRKAHDPAANSANEAVGTADAALAEAMAKTAAAADDGGRKPASKDFHSDSEIKRSRHNHQGSDINSDGDAAADGALEGGDGADEAQTNGNSEQPAGAGDGEDDTSGAGEERSGEPNPAESAGAALSESPAGTAPGPEGEADTADDAPRGTAEASESGDDAADETFIDGHEDTLVRFEPETGNAPRVARDAAVVAHEEPESSDDRPGGATPLDRFIAAVSACRDEDAMVGIVRSHPGDVTWARAKAVAAGAVRFNAAPAGIKRMANIVAECATEGEGLTATTFEAMVKDERNRARDGEVLADPAKAARAFQERITRPGSDVEDFLHCDGQFWVYLVHNLERVDSTGYYRQWSTETVLARALDMFGPIDALANENGSARFVRELAACTERAGYFDDARFGVKMRNGYLRLHDDGQAELLPPTPHQKARHGLPADYDPEAASPALQAYLARSIPAEEQPNFAEIFGAVVFGVRPKRDAARRLAIFYGPTRCGKSVAIDLMCRFMPLDRVGTVPPHLWTNEYHRAALAPLALNVCSELGRNDLGDGQFLKMILAGDPVPARQPGGRPFDFRCSAFHLAATNILPTISDKTEAIERRLNVVTFGKTLEANEVEGDILEHMWSELAGVVNYALSGATRLLARGAYQPSPRHQVAVTTMQHGLDAVAHLAMRFCAAEPSDVTGIPNQVIKKAIRELSFLLHGRNFGENDHMSGEMMRFSELVVKLYGAKRRVSNGVPYYTGIKLLDFRPIDVDGGEAA